MIYQLKHSDIMLLIFHLSVNRKSVKKALKRNYKKGHKDMMKDYDSFVDILTKIESNIDTENVDKINIIEVSDEQHQIIYSFLDSYIKKLKNDDSGVQETNGFKDLKRILKDIDNEKSA